MRHLARPRLNTEKKLLLAGGTYGHNDYPRHCKRYVITVYHYGERLHCTVQLIVDNAASVFK
jgi:hypothetical protein